MPEGTSSHSGQRYCGHVHVEVEGDPVFAAYCLCEPCRKWHSTPMTALAAWLDDAVKIHGEVTVSRKNKESRSTSCTTCGGIVLTTKPGLGWKVLYPLTLSGSEFNYNPAVHIFYDEHVLDFNDGLPKFSDVPAESGGFGLMLDEPSVPGGAPLTAASGRGPAVPGPALARLVPAIADGCPARVSELD